MHALVILASSYITVYAGMSHKLPVPDVLFSGEILLIMFICIPLVPQKQMSVCNFCMDFFFLDNFGDDDKP